MEKRITVLIALLVMAILNISQFPIYAASTASATFTEKPSDMGKAGLRIERERIPSAGQKTNDINSSPGFMESYSRMNMVLLLSNRYQVKTDPRLME